MLQGGDAAQRFRHATARARGPSPRWGPHRQAGRARAPEGASQAHLVQGRDHTERLAGARGAGDLHSRSVEWSDTPGSVVSDHRSRTVVADGLERPTRGSDGAGRAVEPLRAPPPLHGLAPGGAYRARTVAGPAVGSYPTVSPLPDPRLRAAIGGLLSVALSLGSRPVGVTHHLALRSPDVPRRLAPSRSPRPLRTQRNTDAVPVWRSSAPACPSSRAGRLSNSARSMTRVDREAASK